jgi:hypothetical protein
MDAVDLRYESCDGVIQAPDEIMGFRNFLRRRALHRAGCGLVVLLISGHSVAALHRAFQEPKPVDPVYKIPTVVGENVGNLLSLSVQDGRLAPTICTSYEDAAAAFEVMGRSMGGGSSGGGPSAWHCFRMGKSLVLSGRYRLAPTGRGEIGEEQDPWFEFDCIDRTPAGWRFKAMAHDDRRVYIRAIERNGPGCFWLDQRADGSIFVVRIDSAGIVAASSTSFAELTDAQAGVASDLVLKELKQWGISRLSGRYSNEVRRLLLLRFSDPGPEQRDAFDQRLLAMSHPQFQQREGASKWLKENASEHLGSIVSTLLSGELPPEPRSRLRKILDEALKPSEIESFQMIDQQRLDNDPEMLVWLLAEENPSTRSAIRRQLEQVSGQTFGDDLQAWRDWLEQAGHRVPRDEQAESNSPPPEVFPALTGKLLEAAVAVADLLPLTVEGGRMQLDRAHWARLYDDKTVPQLADELRSFMNERKLPSDWLIIGPQLPESLDYPHLIFPRLTAVGEPPAKDRDRVARFGNVPWRPAEPSINLILQSNALRASLEVEEGSHLMTNHHYHGRGDTENVFVVSVSDEPNETHSIFYGAWDKGATSKLLVSAPNAVVQICQSRTACLLDCAVGNATLHRKFDSAEAMLADPHFARKVAQFLQQYGLHFRPAGK